MFEPVNAQIVGISYDSVEVLKSFANEQEIPFALLSDVDSQTIHAYGLHFKDGLPHPGTVVIGQDGVICGKLFEEGYVTRHDHHELSEALEMLK